MITTVLVSPYMELTHGVSKEVETELRNLEPSGYRKIYPNTIFTVSGYELYFMMLKFILKLQGDVIKCISRAFVKIFLTSWQGI
jgi:hypothetical protein